jgi:hypothetical protein
MGNQRTLTQAELCAEATDRFGGNPLDWAFECPACGDVATGQDFSEALAQNPRKERGEGVTVALTASDILGQECIGRTLGALGVPAKKYKGRGCDWVAYGLFPAPWTVELPGGGTMRCFPLAPAPVPAASGEARNG